MKAVSGKALIRILEKHGWQVVRIHGSHHILTKAGSEVRLSVPVHGSATLKTDLVRHVLKLAGLGTDALEPS